MCIRDGGLLDRPHGARVRGWLVVGWFVGLKQWHFLVTPGLEGMVVVVFVVAEQ